MSADVYRYEFPSEIAFEEVQASLVLATMGVESLYGLPQVRLDAGYAIDAGQRRIAIDARTPVGRDLNRLFAGFVLREFGPDSFRVEHPGRTQSMREDSN